MYVYERVYVENISVPVCERFICRAYLCICVRNICEYMWDSLCVEHIYACV